MSRNQSNKDDKLDWDKSNWSPVSSYPAIYPDATTGGSYNPVNNSGAKYTVGKGFWLRAPGGTGNTKSFPGTNNELYLGYELDSNGQPYIPTNIQIDPVSGVDSIGYLNVKCSTIKFYKLVLGNGTVYQGNNTAETIAESLIDVRGNAYITINNEIKDGKPDTRNLTIASPISGSGTLNLTTANKTKSAADFGFYFANPSNAFSGSVNIDAKTRICFQAEDVFKYASSTTCAGYLTLKIPTVESNGSSHANLTFNGPLTFTGTDGSLNFNGKVYKDGDNYKLDSGNVILNSGGTLYNITYTVSDKVDGVSIPDDTRKALILEYGNITNNGSQDLIIHNSEDTSFAGTISVGSNSGTEYGQMIKTGEGKLTLLSRADKSINTEVVINEGTICLANTLYVNMETLKDRFGKDVTINQNGVLECTIKDGLGNGNAPIAFNLNGGTLLLNTESNQTLMNKEVHFTQGTIRSDLENCNGIEVKTGTTFNVHALDGATAQNPTVSTISVPIKVREDHLLDINADASSQLIFTNAVYNEIFDAQGINKYGPGVVTFSYDAAVMEGKFFSELITVYGGVFQLMKDAVITTGPIKVENNGKLEIHVAAGETKKNTIETTRRDGHDITNSIYSTGEVIKTGDGTLQILAETRGMVQAESWVISSGRIDAKGYISGKLSVAANAMLSPGNSIGSLWIEDFIIGETNYSGELILNETGSMLLMEIGGPEIGDNDFLVANGNLTLHNGSIVYLAATDGCTLEPGDTFTAVLSGSNSAAISSNFISKYVRSNDFVDLRYIQLTSGDYAGKYAITGRRYIDPNAVPEPSTWALLILGVAGLFCLKRLQKKKF